MAMPATAEEIERMVMSRMANVADASRITACRIVAKNAGGPWDAEPVVSGPLMHAPLGALSRVISRLQQEFYLVIT